MKQALVRIVGGILSLAGIANAAAATPTIVTAAMTPDYKNVIQAWEHSPSHAKHQSCKTQEKECNITNNPCYNLSFR